jgi:hypothetical protein
MRIKTIHATDVTPLKLIDMQELSDIVVHGA